MAQQFNVSWRVIAVVVLVLCLFALFSKFNISDTSAVWSGSSQTVRGGGGRTSTAEEDNVPLKELVPCPCNIIFEKYFPSEFETSWLKLINTFANKQAFCDIQKKNSDQINLWLKVVDILSKNSSADRLEESHPDYQAASKIFSKMTYSVRCAGQLVKSFEKWIEPISLSMKHPLYNNGCNPQGLTFAQSRAHILLDSIQHREKSQKFMLMDIGAQIYVKGSQTTPSQAYLHSAYKTRGINFNKLMMWDSTPRKDSVIFADVPDEWYPYYQYFNVMPSSELSDPKNPLNLMKLFGSPQHFVSFKVTLGPKNTAVEYQFLKKIMQEPEVYHMIDELFFEPQFQFDGKSPPLQYSYGAFLVQDVYTVFTHMRQLGIRAHGW